MLRLPFAYHGNIVESVPSLAAALLISVFPVIPALTYIILGQPANVFPFEYVGGVVVIAMTFCEIPLIWLTLRKQANIHKARFVRLTLNQSE